MKSRYVLKPHENVTCVMGFIVFLTISVMLIGCQNNIHSTAAPLGKVESLEKLANAYKNQAEKLPVAPNGLTAKGKRKFVEDVFQEAGYDFSKTLQSLSKVPKENINTHHKDMMELLFLPHRGLSKTDLKLVYSESEIDAVKRIELLFAQ